MPAFALRRLLAAIPTLFVLLTLAFFLMRAAPGGPFDQERTLAPQIEAAMKAEYHLDEPLWQQYLRYLDGLRHGDLGPSFQYEGQSVAGLIGRGLPVSLTLGVLAIIVALIVGGALGIAGARRPGSALDRWLGGLTLLGISLPNFVVAPLLVLLFAVAFGWLPAGGWQRGSVADMLLPVLALALPQIAYVARLLRGGLLEAMAAPFVRAARAKGLPEDLILRRHALRPALLPVISHLGPAAAGIVTGSVVIEQIFSIPGIGRYFVLAALNRDYTLVLGVVLVYGTLIIVCNFLVDLLYGWLDPRTRPR